MSHPFRGMDPFGSMIKEEGARLPSEVLLKVANWSRMRNASAPALIVPGAHAASEAFFNVVEDLLPWYAKQHEMHPQLVPTDGTQMVTLPGVAPSPAGVIPTDSRPLIAEKFYKAPRPPGDAWWRELETRSGVRGLADARAAFANSAVYPDWIEPQLDAVTGMVWPSLKPAGVRIKKQSSMGAIRLTTDVFAKQRSVNTWVAQGARMLQMMADARFSDLAEVYSTVLMYVSNYRLQEEGTLKEGRAQPVKERRVQTWDGRHVPMGRRFKEVPKGWDPRILDRRLAARARQIGAGSLDADFGLRCLVRPMIESRLATWPDTYLITSLQSLNDWMSSMRWVGVFDIGNNDQSQGRQMVRAMCRRVDELYDGGGWYLDLLLRAPLLARADVREDSPKAYLSGSPLRLSGFTSHFMVPSGSPFTGELTQLHGTYQACAAVWLYDMGTARSRPFDESFVDDLLSGRHAVKLKITGDNIMFATNDPDYKDLVDEPSRWTPFALLDASPTYAGYVVVRDPAAQTVSANYNIDSVIRRTLFHDRSLDSALRGDPWLGWQARVARLGGHPLGPEWFRKVEEVTAKHFGRPLSEHYKQWSAQQQAATAPFINLAELKGSREANFSFLDDASVIEWKYPLDMIDPRLVDLFFVSVDPRTVEQIHKHVRAVGRRPYL